LERWSAYSWRGSVSDNDYGQGTITISGPKCGDAEHVCALTFTDEDGYFGSIDLAPHAAREIALDLLKRSGALRTYDAFREDTLGPRH
jgi:hypothetical protein